VWGKPFCKKVFPTVSLMKLIFLGTGYAIPKPGRNAPCTMLECGGQLYLLDAGAPVLELLAERGQTPEQIRAVFTTHIHGDHTYGLIPLCSTASWYYKNADFDVYLTEQDGIEAMRQIQRITSKSFCEERIRLKLVQPGEIYRDENITVTAIPTRHMEPYPSYSLMIEGEGRCVILCGDLHSGDAADFPAIAYEPSDAVICELSHFPPAVIFPKAAACPTKRVFFHHIWGNVEANLAAVEEFAKTTPMTVIAPKDGEEYEI